jgi:hypothetical protein
MSKGQFYDSDEEESAADAPRASWRYENVVECDVLAFGSALVVMNDIGKVMCGSLVSQLQLVVIAKLRLGNEVVTEVYASEKRENTDGLVLIWNSVNSMPVENVAEWFELVQRYHVQKWVIVDGLSNVHFPNVDVSSAEVGRAGLRVIKGCAASSFDEAVFASVPVPVLEAGVMVQGPCAYIVNHCDVRGVPCIAVAVIREAAFTVEAARRLELVWSWLESFVGAARGGVTGSVFKSSLERPAVASYAVQRLRDPFLVNTDSLYS